MKCHRKYGSRYFMIPIIFVMLIVVINSCSEEQDNQAEASNKTESLIAETKQENPAQSRIAQGTESNTTLPNKAELIKIRFGEQFLGKANAPITIVEYSSLSCPHCAVFHTETLPKLEKYYIDTGTVKYVNRDFPLNASALAASVLANCTKGEYNKYLKVFFKSQEDWAFNKEFKEKLTLIAKANGMSDKEISACFADKTLKERIANTRLAGEKILGVDATPTFFINGVKHRGSITFEELEKQIKKLQKANAKN